MWTLGMLNTWGSWGRKKSKEELELEVEYSKLDFIDKVERKLKTSNFSERVQKQVPFKIKEVLFDRDIFAIEIKGTLGELALVSLEGFCDFIGEEI